MNSPVAFFVFNRPACASQVWAEIRKAAPSVLLIVADGPRHEADRKKCDEVLKIVAQVDWPCEVRRNYSEINMGCRNRMATGLDWVFDQVEEAIILEDDCVPCGSFFTFCDQMLEHYRQDTRVMHISGSNFRAEQVGSTQAYSFVKYIYCWGWATWRRAWKFFDLNVSNWPLVKETGLLASVCSDKHERALWADVFDLQYRRCSNAWDYSWVFACWTQMGLSISPRVNLVSNVGVGDDSTHIKCNYWYMNLPVGEIGGLTHQSVIIVNTSSDRWVYKHMFKPSLWTQIRYTMLNPWFYGGMVRKLPVAGSLWIRWRQWCKRGNIR